MISFNKTENTLNRNEPKLVNLSDPQLRIGEDENIIGYFVGNNRADIWEKALYISERANCFYLCISKRNFYDWECILAYTKNISNVILIESSKKNEKEEVVDSAMNIWSTLVGDKTTLINDSHLILDLFNESNFIGYFDSFIFDNGINEDEIIRHMTTAFSKDIMQSEILILNIFVSNKITFSEIDKILSTFYEYTGHLIHQFIPLSFIESNKYFSVTSFFKPEKI